MKFVSKILILFVLLCLIQKFNWKWPYKIIYDIPEPIKDSKVDFDILDKGCDHSKMAFKLANQ
jgi:hypothetical protein